MRKVLAALLVGVAIAAVTVYAQTKDRSAVEKQLIANERAINEAFAKADVAGFNKFIAADGVGIDPMLGVIKASEYGNAMKEAKIQLWNIDKTAVHWASDDVAILTYRWTGKGTFQGQPIPPMTWASTTWVNQKGTWRAVFHQETIGMEPPKK
jgi:hypothetical protein